MNTHTTHTTHITRTMPNPTLKLKLPAAAATLPLPALPLPALAAAALPLLALAASLLILSLLAAPAARAADVYWGGGTGALTDDNWFDATATKVTRANADVINLSSGTLYVAGVGVVYDTNIGLASGDNAAVIVSGTWNNTNGELSIGNALGSTGALTILASGSVRANTFYVGNAGSGTFYLAEGAMLTNAANAMFGRNTGGSGTATIDGTWRMDNGSGGSGALSLGYIADSRGNRLDIGAHGSVTIVNNYLRIGAAASTSGIINIASGGLLSVNNTANGVTSGVGYGANSSGTVNIAQGGAMTINSSGSLSNFYIGGNATGAYGEANVDGLLSYTNTFTAGDRIFAVGYGVSNAISSIGVLNIGQTGTVNIQGASEVALGRMGVGSGYASSASGTINVAGLLNTNGTQLLVGRSGDAYLNIASTGTVLAGNTRVSNGNHANGISHGEINVAGYLGITGWLDIGASGIGAVTIDSTGTVVTTADFTVGRSTNSASGTRSYGILDIHGYARSNDNLVIANDGVGTLNLYTGGVAYSTNAANIAITAQSSGTFNLLGGFFSTPTFTWGAGTGVVTLSSGTLEIRNSDGALDIANANALSGAGTIEKTGPGALGFGGDSSAFAGALNIRSGALRSTAATARLGGNINIASGAALDLRSAALETTGNLTLADGALWMFSPTGQYQLTASNLIIDGAGQIYLDPEVPLASIPVSYTLASYTAITGDTNIANWLVTASGTIVYGSTIAATANTIQLQLNTIGASFLYWKGGDGDWGSAATDWRDGPSPVAWKHGSVGVFQNGPGTVNITGNQIFSTLQFDTDGYTLAGTGFLTGPLGGPLNFNVTTPAATATINVPVSGAALYKTGPGALVLGGPVTTTGATGHVLIDGGTLAVGGETAIGGQLFVGGTATGTGAFVVKNGATVNQARETFVAYDGDSSGLVRIETGGVFNQTGGYFRIAGINNNAVATTGTLIVETGGTLNAAENIHIGSSGAATAQIDGYLHTNASSYIGVYAGGNATVTVGQAGVFDSTGILSLGYNATSTGTLFVEGLARAGSHLRLGDGTGSQNNVLDIASTGTLVTGGYAAIGFGANAHGAARVAGLLDVATSLPIAYSGTSTGVLEILSGGTVIQRGATTNYVAAAVGVDSTGTLIIRSGGYLDTGARAHASQANFGIGWAGQGSLLIETGGTAISAAADANSVAFSLGYGASAYGSADIAGTLVAATGYADIGQSGTGVLTIEDGGLFLADRVRLATGANARATVNLNGGVLEARQFILGAGGANVTVAFAGGTIRAAADESNFFQNFPMLPLASGTLNLDTQVFAVTATNALAGSTDARLVKFGTGSLTLSADNSAYIGAVDVRAGSLDTAGARLGGSVTIGSGAAIRPTVAGGVIDDLTIAAAGALDLRNAPLTAGNLTLADGALWQYSLSGTHVIDVTGILDIAGSGTFYLSRDGKDITLIPGSYTLATYAGITGDANLATWQITASDFSLTASTALDTLSVPNTLKININTADVDLLHWQGGDGDWDTSTASFRRTGSPTAWNDGALAVFSTGSGAVDITGVRTIYALQFDTDGYTLAGSGALAAASAVNIHLTTPGATTTINTTLDFPGLNKLGPGDLVLGGASAFTEAVNVAAGSLTIAPTGDISSATLEIAPGAADTAAVTLDTGALWQSAGRVTVGGTGAGSLDIADGAALTVNGAYVFIGDAAGSSGTATVAGLMQTVSSGEIHVGRYGDGALVIAQTGTVKSAVSSHIARYSGTGRATVEGLWENTADLALGFAADAVGVIDIRSTGSVTGRHAYIGYGAGGTGTATVAGLWQNSGNLYVGRQGDGSLDIAQGGAVTATGTGYIASAAGSTGTVRVAGLLDVGSLLYIGNEGSGSLDIAPTGTVNNTGFAWIGYTPTSRGTVNVDGLWQSAANILVGGSLGGTGLLTIGATGTVTNPNAYIGWGENTTGTVTVRGHWNPTGGIVVGYGANAVGTLIVESGGTVSPSTASRIASTAGASGTLIIKTGGVWHSGAGINVGYAGSGSAFIHVETGGTLVMDSTTLYVADPAGAYGEVLIDGYYRSGTGGAGVPDQPGSYYTPVGYRNGGVGVFTVGATGTAISGVIDVGRETGSSGTVTINGYWGVAAMTEQSRVGNSGTGVLTIAQGGILISDAIDADGSALNIGNNANGRGVVNVAGLLVHNNGGLTNGRLGIGALNIASTGTVLLAGQYKQNQNSTLTIATDPARPDAYVTAGSFSLSGTLALTGPGLDYTPVAKASELPDTGVLVLTATSGGIHGNFNTVTGFGGGAPDYLAPGGHVRDEGNNITTYRAGYRLSWDAPTGAHGTFTLADGETFEIDVPLADRVGETDPNWDKKSLTKRGGGTLILSGQNTFTGAITVASGTLRLGGPALHRYGALVNNGVFDLGAPPAPGQFRTLEVASLSGAGAFRMTIDPAAGDGDRLIVNGDATGSHQLLVSANSANGGAPQTLTLATITGANNATITGGFDYNGVNYTVAPTGPGSYGFSTNGASGIFHPIHGVPGSQSLMWFASQDNLSRRLGELRAEAASSRFSEVNNRFPEVETASSLLSQTLADAASSAASSSSASSVSTTSLWLRARAEHDSLGSGGTDIRPFDMDLYGFEFGADKTIAITNARIALGLYAAYGHATQDFDPRAGTGAADGSSDQIGLGLYAAWLHTTGWFANITLAAARYDNDFTSHDQSGNRTAADYNDNAIGASLEFGKRIALDRAIAPGWFLEPTAQASLAQLLRDDYHTTGANDLDIRASDTTITRLRATLRAGRTWRELELSARLGASHETSSGGQITITDINAAPWRPNVDGTRAEAGLGLIWRPTTAGQLYFDYEFATGDACQKPWSFSLGYRHAF
jgi:outer membrane autotransporter protein